MKWKFCIEDIGNEMETVEIIGDEFSDGQQSPSDALRQLVQSLNFTNV